MNGKGREVADLMARRKIGVLCLQETRWKGNKARDLGEGCKLIYSGANRDSRNGVGILLSVDLKDSLVGVSRRNDRIMSIELGFEKSVNVVGAYAPQVGCREEEKDEFWEQLEQELSLIPDGERVILGGDLNGHVGRRRDGIERMHGGWGIGERNAEGERVMDFAMTFGMAICNTFLQKRDCQFVTYKSGGRESQIDFPLWRKEHFPEMRNCKVIKGESVAAQHKLVVGDLEIECRRKGKPRRIEPKIKWWRLKEEGLKREFNAKVLETTRHWDGVQEWWEKNSAAIRKGGEEVLGKTSGKGPPADKETWWWSEQVKQAVKAKKMAKKKWDLSGLQEDKMAFKEAKKRAKKEVAKAKAIAMKEVEEEIETPGGERKLYRIAKAQDKASKDFTQIKQIKDERGAVLSDESKIKERWGDYFEHLLNEENPRAVYGDGEPNENLTPAISREEVVKALRKMKKGKATGPDNIPVEVWKSLGEEGIYMLWDLMEKIHQEENMPEEWRDSAIVPIYKEKGDIQECGNYRG